MIKAFGFAGADIVSVGDCHGVAIYGLDVELNRQFGEHNDHFPSKLRNMGTHLQPWTRALCDQFGKPIFDIGIIRKKGAATIDIMIEMAAALHRRKVTPVAISCDHTASYAQAVGLSLIRPITYIYFDAHLDLGWHLPLAAEQVSNGTFVSSLLTYRGISKVISIGARSASCSDPRYGAITSPVVIPFDDPDSVIKELEPLTGQDVYVSIDADILDPSFLPALCCPVPFGVDPKALLRVLRWISQKCRVAGADLSECCLSLRRADAETLLRLIVELVIRN